MGFIVSKLNPENGVQYGVNTSQYNPDEWFIFVKVKPEDVLPDGPFKYWKNDNGTLTKMTTTEKDVVDTNELLASISNALVIFNRERAVKLEEFDWRWLRHQQETELAVATSLDSNAWTEWLAYAQGLRNLPSTAGFNPSSPVWPTQPL